MKSTRLMVFSWSVLCALLLSMSSTSHAVIETYEFSSSSLEQRYKTLSAELRCPKCQNQNIADSNAPIAQDLRKLLFKQLEAGANDEDILEHMVSRYGEFVRYKPRFSGVTLMLWLMPAALLLMAIIIVLMAVRRSGHEASSGAISTREQRQLDELLGNGSGSNNRIDDVESDT